MLKIMLGLKRLKGSLFVLSLAAVYLCSACSAYRLRTVAPAEKRNFLISSSLDQAIIDPLERGPLNSLASMVDDGEGPYATPLELLKHQKNLIEKDLIKVGYEDNEDEMGMSSMSGGEKTQSIVITVLIITGVLVGAAIPILFLLDVF